ncbi:MAG TPA: RDD family protein, partial [Verrucomicrobiota bacterium]|nr:RDD family protein [Verrucomicrobiota bacterium]
MKTSVLQIKTAEGVVFSQLLAGPVTRFMAWLIDAMCIGAALTILGYVLGFLGLINADIAGALSALAYFVLSIGYGMAFEWAWRGQTVGKRLFRLRVV